MEGLHVTTFRLGGIDGVAGELSFVFRESPSPVEALPLLKRLSRAVEAMWRLPYLEDAYAFSAARVAELETELANSKIVDRAKGMLEVSAENSELVAIIERHVENVLRSTAHVGNVLERIKKDLEDELLERSLAAQAKSILRATSDMTEEQAHLKLRTISRQTRRPLRDVARELIEAR